jgi:hypothetical protein
MPSSQRGSLKQSKATTEAANPTTLTTALNSPNDCRLCGLALQQCIELDSASLE